MPPLWVQLWSFTLLCFIVSLVGIKKMMEGRRDIKGEKEGVEQERRKERKIILKEIKNNNNYFKTKIEKKKACWLQTGQASFAGLFGCIQLRGPSPGLLCSDQHLDSLRPSSPEAPGYIGSVTHLPPGYGCMQRAFRGRYSPQCLWSQAPPRCAVSMVLRIWAQCPQHPCGSTGWQGGEKTGADAAG